MSQLLLSLWPAMGRAGEEAALAALQPSLDDWVKSQTPWVGSAKLTCFSFGSEPPAITYVKVLPPRDMCGGLPAPVLKMVLKWDSQASLQLQVALLGTDIP